MNNYNMVNENFKILGRLLILNAFIILIAVMFISSLNVPYRAHNDPSYLTNIKNEYNLDVIKANEEHLINLNSKLNKVSIKLKTAKNRRQLINYESQINDISKEIIKYEGQLKTLKYG